MSYKKVRQVKQDKYFRIWDLLVYGAVIVIIVALLLYTLLTRDSSPADGIKVSYRGEQVMLYDYSSGDLNYNPDYIEIQKNDDTQIIAVFYTADKSGYNIIKIDKGEHSAEVTDANCSTHKDCVYTPAIKDNSSAISCPPHLLIIEPTSRTMSDDGII